jgi:hypothetical protein
MLDATDRVTPSSACSAFASSSWGQPLAHDFLDSLQCPNASTG